MGEMVPDGDEAISIRGFARLVGLKSHKAVQKAIAGGRLRTHDIGGRWPVLYKGESLAAWRASRHIENGNRFGELEGDGVAWVGGKADLVNRRAVSRGKESTVGRETGGTKAGASGGGSCDAGRWIGEHGTAGASALGGKEALACGESGKSSCSDNRRAKSRGGKHGSVSAGEDLRDIGGGVTNELEDGSEDGKRTRARGSGNQVIELSSCGEGDCTQAVVEGRGSGSQETVDAESRSSPKKSRKAVNGQAELRGASSFGGVYAETSDGGGQDDLDEMPWGVRYTMERAFLVEEQRKIANLEREELEGHLHRDEDVEAVWSSILLAFRTKILSMPTKLAYRLGSMTGYADIGRLQGMIEDECREALSELSRYDASKAGQIRKRRSGK